jgi:translation elongation factor P/translation initiation factor 5A
MKEIYEDSDKNTNLNVRKNLFELPYQYLWDYIMNRLFHFMEQEEFEEMEIFPQYSKL